MSRDFFSDDDDEPTFFQRHRLPVALVAVAVIGSGVWTAAKFFKGDGSAPRRAPEVTMVKLAPLPPPPPPPPLPPQQAPPPEQKMIAQEPVNEPEDKPEPKPADEPPPDLGTNVKGDGPADGFGLSGRPGGGRIGGTGNGGGQRSKWGWYAGQVQSRVADGLRQNRKTRAARIAGLQVRVWPDSTGRIARAQLAGSTGDPAVDAAIRSEVLTGLQLEEAPPPGMPTPIVLRLSARRPH